MSESWESVVTELELATARLNQGNPRDLDHLGEAVHARSLAIRRLHRMATGTPGPVPETLLDRLKQDCRQGAEAAQRLLLLRAEARATIAKLAEELHLLRSLAPTENPLGASVNCAG